jgi:hypothetical protein
MAGVTLLRQDDDIRPSGVYLDNVAPTEADYETNTTDLEDDLTNVRSMLHTLLKKRTGNWFDDLATPSTFEGGAQRAVDDVNQDLHDLERKRVLRCIWNLHSISIALAGDTFVILAAGQLPSNTTAAVGAVTTQGTVVAFSAIFAAAALDEVGGSTAISPKNLVEIVDVASRDPITDADDRIYGLLQTETAADGHTITDTTTTRAQISFVKINGAGTDLIAISSGAMDGKSFDYCSVERVALEDLNEQDFLGGANVDVPAGATVTRQAGYDNQGTTPVDVTTASTLDLEGPGLTWTIRDDLQAVLFEVFEGSVGGTSEVRLGAAVDVFNNDAVDNDFLNGATIGTTGTGIQIAETAGVIERADDLTMRASGGDLILDDAFRPSSGWSLPGIHLADSIAEWNDFETEFGEVSLLAAIKSASDSAPSRLYHVQSANVSADADIGGPGTAANNLDVDFPDAWVTLGILNTWLYLNGRLMQPGADAAANNDYYPGTTFGAGDVEIKFERNTKAADVYVSLVF